MAEQDPQRHSENPPAVTVEWPEGAETYIAATPIIDVAQGLLTACKAMVGALARHAGDAGFGAEDARALEAGRAAIAVAEGHGAGHGAG
jgi:hypothetical protein